MRYFIALTFLVLQASPPAQSGPIVPNFPDTTIKTRSTHGLQSVTVTTLMLKGGRVRRQTGPDGSSVPPSMVQITQCDQARTVMLMTFNKTFHNMPIHAYPRPAGNVAVVNRFVRTPAGSQGRPEVTITTDSEDTHERRNVGSFQARHIKTTITVEPGPGALTPSGKTKVDGWYFDVPGLNCSDEETPGPVAIVGWHVPMMQHGHDSFKYVHNGVQHLGYAIEEAYKEKSAHNIVINKTELVDFSDKPLEPSLFEIPADYTEAPVPRMVGQPAVPAKQ